MAKEETLSSSATETNDNVDPESLVQPSLSFSESPIIGSSSEPGIVQSSRSSTSNSPRKKNRKRRISFSSAGGNNKPHIGNSVVSPLQRIRQSFQSASGHRQPVPETRPLLPLYSRHHHRRHDDNDDVINMTTTKTTTTESKSTPDYYQSPVSPGALAEIQQEKDPHNGHEAIEATLSTQHHPTVSSVVTSNNSDNSDHDAVHFGYAVRSQSRISDTSPKSSVTVEAGNNTATNGNGSPPPPLVLPTMDASATYAATSTTKPPVATTTSTKKETRRNSLLSGSRKVVKATLKPARAVSRLFRGNSGGTKTTGGATTVGGTHSKADASVTATKSSPSNGMAGYGTLEDLNGVVVVGTGAGGDGIVVLDPTTLSPSMLQSHRSVGSQVPRLHPSGVAATTFTKTTNWAVHSMESLTRHVVLVCIAYIVGVHHPEWITQVSRATEFAVTAWVTCMVILSLSFFQQRFSHVITSERDQYDTMMMAAQVQVQAENAVRGVPGGISSDVEGERIPLLNRQAPKIPTSSAANGKVVTRETDDDGHLSHVQQALVDRVPSVDEPAGPPQPSGGAVEHPSLSKFYVIDAYSGQRVHCNSAIPHHISNEWFEMDMLVLIRTPDADDSSAPKGTPANEMVSTYMRGRQRRFEFQYQVKLKKTPVGKQVYFACELDETVKMGIVTKAFVGAAMAFVKTTNATFQYSISGSKDKAGDGKYEKPHMSFTVEGSLDRLVVTKRGETPPQLGQPIYEDPESIKRRKKGILTDWNTEDTYTFALWSSYVDFLDWKVLNLPGIRPFGLSSVLGTQAINLTMYFINEKRDSDKHYRKDIEEIVKLELSNCDTSEMGPAAKMWSQSNDRLVHQSGASVSTTAASTNVPPPSNRGRTFSEDSNIAPRKLNAPSEVEGKCSDFDTLLTTACGGEDIAMEDIEEVDEDVVTAAELGEGIYLRSGDSVVLRELMVDDENARSYSVGVGGGFAVLQEQDVTVVITKAKVSKKNKLIKSGDTVTIKMLQKKSDSDDMESKYLTIHRGWWLKWVTNMPSKNGYFSIYTHETEVGDTKNGVPIDETQSSFLAMGGTFTLRHKRWSKFHVGIAAEPSTTYGGRLLGLYNPTTKGNMADDEKHQQQYASDDEFDLEKDDPAPEKAGWMKPLVLCALDPSSMLTVPSSTHSSPLKISSSFDDDEESKDLPLIAPGTKLIFSNEHSQADVPAWIEMMDRTARVRQLAYVVRVVYRSPTRSEEKLDDTETSDLKSEGENKADTLVRLRTGKELARIMSIGQSIRLPHIQKPAKAFHETVISEGANHELSPRQRSYSDEKALTRSLVDRHSFDDMMASGTPISLVGPMKSTDGSPRRRTINHINLRDRECYSDQRTGSFDSDDVDIELEEEDGDVEEKFELDESAVDEDYIDDEGSISDISSDGERERKGALQAGKKLLGKSGKLVKKTVVGTGRMTAKTAKKAAKGTGKLSGKLAKGTVKQSKKVVKGTVKTGAKGLATAGSITKTTGKALIAPVTRKSHKPPKAEPKKKHKEKEDLLGVSKRMKKLQKAELKTASAPAFIAGELCAPEQSCRTASRVLSRMSNVQFMSTAWHKCNEILSSEVGFSTEQDRWFLQGSAIHLGVTPNKGDLTRGELLEGSLVARCLWESHWREEWCGMYESCLSFYSPLASSACLEIAYIDITDVRPLDAGERSPLPGFPLLVLETAWLCHYIAFRDDESRDTFGEKLECAIQSHIRHIEETASLEQSELRRARFWQGFQTLSETSLSSGAGKWAKITSNQKKKGRTILNGRRMPFDVSGAVALAVMTDGLKFVENLLFRALSISLESLENDPESFVEFLDLTSQLRFFPLDEIDLSSPGAFCFFVNIFHCLLQQALLLSVNGPLQKKSVGHFMRTSCYEIGGDVFSLAELQCCVIRGKMAKPNNGNKPPYVDAPKKSIAYRYYALDYTDARVHFVLNTGDMACPSSVPVLTPLSIEPQLKTSSAIFLENQMVLDAKRRLIVLPKVCDVFRNDFGSGDSLSVLKTCVNGMEEQMARAVRLMLMDEHNLIIKFQHTQEQYHSSLKLRLAEEEKLDSDQITFQPMSSESLDLMDA